MTTLKDLWSPITGPSRRSPATMKNTSFWSINMKGSRTSCEKLKASLADKPLP